MQKFALVFLAAIYSISVAGQEPTPTPQPIKEEVTVSATGNETQIGSTPASVKTISRREIVETAAPVLDDVLRRSVGFSLFRRSSSRNANPTTQGVSLRGVGASGASRTTVLLDGIPLNDPFGGWIAWNRVSPIEIETVEVLRGGASSLYGDAGLSGAINIYPRQQVERFSFAADIFGGTQRTASAAGRIGFKIGKWSGAANSTNFHTRGYVPIDEAVRGPVDGHAGVRSAAYSGRFVREFNDTSFVFVSPSYFGEVRTNGTGLQTNRTHRRQISAGGRIGLEQKGNLKADWRVFGGTQVYDQVFSAVNALRTSESLTRIQRVPAQDIGYSATISGVFKDHTLIGGTSGRNVRGASDEIGYAAGIATSMTGNGGRQNSFGAFVQDLYRVGDRVVIMAGIRFDRWRNSNGVASTTTLATGQQSSVNFPERNEDAFSPRLSILVQATDNVSLYAGASRNFRSPTLNELYRGFRVGNVVTLPNEGLLSERSNSVEAGLMFRVRNLFVRGSGFMIETERAVANVTLSTTLSLITRQRQNAGEIRSAGIEAEAEFRWRSLSLLAGYHFANATVRSFPANPVLVGLAIPQTARHQATFQMRYSVKNWVFTAQTRAASSQFDDDLNTFKLEPYSQTDLFVSRGINSKIVIYSAVENVFNSRYSVARTPIRSVNSPINVRLGFRWR